MTARERLAETPPSVPHRSTLSLPSYLYHGSFSQTSGLLPRQSNVNIHFSSLLSSHSNTLSHYDKTVTFEANKYHYSALHPRRRTHTVSIYRNYHRSSHASLLTTIILCHTTHFEYSKRVTCKERGGTVIDISPTAYLSNPNIYLLSFILSCSKEIPALQIRNHEYRAIYEPMLFERSMHKRCIPRISHRHTLTAQAQ